jgi:hypothetical protein
LDLSTGAADVSVEEEWDERDRGAWWLDIATGAGGGAEEEEREKTSCGAAGEGATSFLRLHESSFFDLSFLLREATGAAEPFPKNERIAPLA